MSEFEYIGLDLETSGVRHDIHVPIQLGISMPNGETRSWLVNGWHWYGELPPVDGMVHWDEGAFNVHGITKDQLDKDGQPPTSVAQEAAAFVLEHSAVDWAGPRKPVGWNVASFDMPFVAQHFPALKEILSYQAADLNAGCFLLSEALGLDFKQLKKDTKDYAVNRLAVINQFKVRTPFRTAAAHDAGYDAALAVQEWEYLVARTSQGY